MNALRLFLIYSFLAVLLLSGCATTPEPIHYYRWQDSVFVQPAHSDTLVRVIPTDFLNSQNMVYETSATTVHFAKRHLWVEAPAKPLARILAAHLNQQNPQMHYGVAQESQPQARIEVVFTRFQGAYDGHVYLEGYAHFYDANGQSIRLKSFAIRQPQQQDGYAAMATSLQDALSDVVTMILR